MYTDQRCSEIITGTFSKISFEEAVLRFYKSETYKTLQETENGLWAESAEYIADRYYEEIAG